MKSSQPEPRSDLQPGAIVLFGSGETSPQGRKVFDHSLRKLPLPPRIVLLETPAGFELNSAQVIGRVADFLQHRLQNYNPQIQVIPARKRGTPFSPDDPQLVAPILQANLIFMGPGSPTYAVRQLRDSLAWQMLLARHRLGATLALASAATIAFSACALPVYEIYKVGADLHWQAGLDFFGLYGLSLVFIPHWNNNDGGAELDTSRCFMGQARFAQLMEMLPNDYTVIGIDEKTALLMEPEAGECRVSGLGGVTLIHTGHHHTRGSVGQPTDLPGSGLAEVAELRAGHIHRYTDGQTFSLAEIGPFRPYHPEAGLPADIWQQALAIAHQPSQSAPLASPAPQNETPPEIQALVAERQAARERKEWSTADALRQRLIGLGWSVQDTPQGMKVSKDQ